MTEVQLVTFVTNPCPPQAEKNEVFTQTISILSREIVNTQVLFFQNFQQEILGFSDSGQEFSGQEFSLIQVVNFQVVNSDNAGIRS